MELYWLQLTLFSFYRFWSSISTTRFALQVSGTKWLQSMLTWQWRLENGTPKEFACMLAVEPQKKLPSASSPRPHMETSVPCLRTFLMKTQLVRWTAVKRFATWPPLTFTARRQTLFSWAPMSLRFRRPRMRAIEHWSWRRLRQMWPWSRNETICPA